MALRRISPVGRNDRRTANDSGAFLKTFDPFVKQLMENERVTATSPSFQEPSLLTKKRHAPIVGSTGQRVSLSATGFSEGTENEGEI
jgi:hypothetical protein